MSRNYTQTLGLLVETMQTVASGQAIMQATLESMARTQERLVEYVMLGKQTGDAAAAPAPAKPKAGKQAQADAPKAAAVKERFTSYLKAGDLYVGLLLPEGVEMDEIMGYDVRNAVHAKMQAAHKDTYVWLDDSGKVMGFRNPPKARPRNGYAVMRCGRPQDATQEAAMTATVKALLVPAVK